MKLKKYLLSILGVSALLFGGALLSNKTQPKKLVAAPERTEVPAIKITFDGNSIWGWTSYHVYYHDAIVKEGTSPYNAHDEYNIAANNADLSNYEKVFPVNVLSIKVLLKGTNGNGNYEEYLPIEVTQGESLIGSPEWNSSAGKGQLKVINKKDYFSEYKLHDGLTGGINNDKVRLWLYRGHYGTDDATVVLNVDDKLTKASGHVKTRAGDAGDHHKYFAYFDVLSSEIVGKNINFHKISGDNTTIWNTSTTHAFVAGDNNKLFKLPVNDDQTNLLSHGPIEGEVSNDFLAKMLEGYLTCSDSIENGFGAFEVMDNNLIPRKSGNPTEWNYFGDLDDVRVYDYPGEDDAVYSDDRVNSVPVEVEDKYEALQLRFGSSPNKDRISYPTSDDNSLTATIIIGVIGITTLAGYYFITKKSAIKV